MSVTVKEKQPTNTQEVIRKNSQWELKVVTQSVPTTEGENYRRKEE